MLTHPTLADDSSILVSISGIQNRNICRVRHMEKAGQRYRLEAIHKYHRLSSPPLM